MSDYFNAVGTPDYSQFIHLSRYSRWLEEEGRRETWEETTRRYVDFFAGRFPELKDEILSLQKEILNFKVMPSMRCFMTAGKALEKDEVAGYNCLSGDTLVTTKECGIVPIKSLAGKSVHVVDGNGDWVLAPCKSYGAQSLSRVTFATSGKGSFHIDATADHRWVMKDGTIKLTKNLATGDRLSCTRFEIEDFYENEDYFEGVKHGIVYGDGTANYKVKAQKRMIKGFAIRLCSDAEDLMPYFKNNKCSYPPSFNGEPVVYLYGDDFAIDLKSLPDLDNPIFTREYLIGFIRGWFAADGTVSNSGQICMASNKGGLDWIYAAATRTGFVPRNHSIFPEKTNLGVRSQDLYRVNFDRRYLHESDMIISRKRERFSPIASAKMHAFSKVQEVVHLGITEEVYCFEVPTTQSFLLHRNILTGNCAYVAIDHPKAFDEILYVLMCGTGVGFSVERQYVNKLPDIAESFYESDTTIVVPDSKIGWATSFRELLSLLYGGKVPKWDLSRLRPAGARLKTFGGRSSGPQPLENLFRFTCALFKRAAGRKLNSIECHDLVCKIADIVVVGGVRRCLPEWTLVHTIDGLKQIQDVQPGDLVQTGQERYRQVSAKKCVGKRDVVTIKTQMGDFVCTPEHRMGVLSDLDGGISWVSAANLEPGKHSLVFYKNVLPGRATCLPPWNYNKPKHSTTCKDITVPELNQEMAWFFGQLHGDGCVYRSNRQTSDANGYVSIACADDYPEQHTRVVNALGKFGCKVLAYNGLEEKCSKPRVNSHQLAEYLSQFKRPNTSIDVPNFIMEGLPDIRAAYVAGLFDADGAKNRPILVAASIYPDYLRQVQALLSSLGIVSYIKLNRAAVGNWQDLYHLCLKGIDNIEAFADLVGRFSVKVKQDALYPRKKEQNSFIVPKSLIKESAYKSLFAHNQVHDDKINISWKFFEQKAGPRNFIPIGIQDVVCELDPVVCWDIQVDGDECFVAEGVLTHNSALLSLSNVSDDRMRLAKSGQWWAENGQRRLSNNSACYTEKPELEIFMKEWSSLYESKSGERGIFNRIAAQKKVAENGRRIIGYDMGCNPCSEILLRSAEFCNLSEIIVRPDDTLEELKEKARVATIFGTLQATLTNFRYLRKIWANNTAEERLLGVSMTGIMDHKTLSNPENSHLKRWLTEIKETCIDTNKEWAAKLGIEESAAITCVKPSGTVSQLCNTASGIHARFSDHYIRRVRIDTKDPLGEFMKNSGFPSEVDVMSKDNLVFSFPIKAPPNSVKVKDISALQQLEVWKVYQDYWCEHKPSCTVYYNDDDFLAVGSWVWQNFDDTSGISFLPYSDHIYNQSPYESISEDKYKELLDAMPKDIDWLKLQDFEEEDNTAGSQTYACTGGACEIVDLVNE